LLDEKIKADNKRVDVLKIEPADNSLPDLSGGYITKADKTTGGDPSHGRLSAGMEVLLITFITCQIRGYYPGSGFLHPQLFLYVCHAAQTGSIKPGNRVPGHMTYLHY